MVSESPPHGCPDCAVYIAETVEDRIARDSADALSKGMEAMGLLYGHPFMHGKRKLLRIEGAAALPTVGTMHHVIVDRKGDVDDSWSGSGSVVVGWYHSHTGVGSFMSETDIRTHRRWFGETLSVAAVYEAVEKDLGIYMLVGGEAKRADFAVYRRSPTSP